MAFDVSSRNVKLDSDNNLQAECMNLRKEWEDAAIPLKDFVSNDDGTLAWGGRSFKDSARNVGLRESRFLEGELRDMRGVWKFASLDLSLYIRNFDGALRAFDDQPEYLADKSWHGANCYIINEVLGSCLDLDNGKSINGTKTQGWSFISGNQNQIWCLEQVNTNSVWSAWTLRNLRSGTYLDLSNGNPTDNTMIQGWQRALGDDKANQQWFLTSQEEYNATSIGYFRIQNANSFTYLTLTNLELLGQGIVGSHRQEHSGSQRWKLQRS